MKALIFGATGMVGQGVLRECLLEPGVESVRAVGRSATGVQHPKLREMVRPDLFHYADIEPELKGIDACFFLSRRVLSRHVGKAIREPDLYAYTCGSGNAGTAKSRDDIHLRFGGGDR